VEGLRGSKMVAIIEIQDSGSEMDEVAIIEIPTKTLDRKRKVSHAPKYNGDKRRRSETRNDTDSIPEEKSRAGKTMGTLRM
jgi:hypothetical protein